MEKEAKDREIPFKPIKLNFFPRQLKAHQELWTYDVEELVYGGGAGGGKIVADDSAVLTPFGFKQGSDLEVGDLINDPDGGTQKIIQIKPRVELERWTVLLVMGLLCRLPKTTFGLLGVPGRAGRLETSMLRG